LNEESSVSLNPYLGGSLNYIINLTPPPPPPPPPPEPVYLVALIGITRKLLIYFLPLLFV